jgi:hypothetical protein
MAVQRYGSTAPRISVVIPLRPQNLADIQAGSEPFEAAVSTEGWSGMETGYCDFMIKTLPLHQCLIYEDSPSRHLRALRRRFYRNQTKITGVFIK